MAKAPQKTKLNGSVDRLAAALRDVIGESNEQIRDEVKTDMREMESRLNERIDGLQAEVTGLGGRIDTTNQNMQAQLAQHRQDIAEDVRAMLDERTS